MKIKTLFIALALVCLIGSISVATAAKVTKIGNGHDPSIYDSKVTWNDPSGVIHLYDLAAKKDTILNSSKASHPDIYSNKIVWLDNSSGKPRIAIYDIPSRSKIFITKNVDDRSYPQIYGKRIVWSANESVYLRDLSTSMQTKIGSGEVPDVYDAKVVYKSDTETEYDHAVRLYDINTKKKITISSSGIPETPHIWGTKIIWADSYNHQGYILMYDTSTKKTTAVTDELGIDPNGNEYGASTGLHIAIQDGKIVYSKVADDYEGKPGVYLYSIASGKRTLLVEYPENIYTTPEVYDNKVVWGTYREGTNDTGIYVYTLPTKPVAAFTADKTSGKNPLTVTFKYTGKVTPDTYLWDFGDGIKSKHAVTATHKYNKAGSYTVKLTVTNSAGSSTITKKNYIVVK
ncbi:MAG TPA: PKD domain-containing protein [Methanosarcina sp.]|nr:PKD domain-containing protein [Methanosarcina sp.]